MRLTCLEQLVGHAKVPGAQNINVAPSASPTVSPTKHRSNLLSLSELFSLGDWALGWGVECVYFGLGVLVYLPVLFVYFVVASLAYQHEVFDVGLSVVAPVFDVVCFAP